MAPCEPPALEDVLPARLVVLVSGAGTTLQALLDAADDPSWGAHVVAVGADREGTPGQERACAQGLPTFVCRVADLFLLPEETA